MATKNEKFYVRYCPYCPYKNVGNWYLMIEKQTEEHIKKHKKKAPLLPPSNQPS